MTTRIHHLNCATMCPLGGKLISGERGLLTPARMVCHCLLVETNDGLVLVDTGLGLADIAAPERLGALFVNGTRPRLVPAETAVRQVQRLGFSPADVRHIVLTHLDLDHAGGIGDFPHAKVHLLGGELEAALAPRNIAERTRYRAIQWAHGPSWVRHSVKGESWYGFESVQALPDVSPELLLIPLIGHTRGHTGVAVKGPGGWLLHCGDAYFFRGEMEPTPHCPPGLKLFQSLVAIEDKARRANRDRLQGLAQAHGSEVRLFCAHDPVELERFQATRPLPPGPHSHAAPLGGEGA